MTLFLLEKKKRKRNAQSGIRRFANEFAPERISRQCFHCINVLEKSLRMHPRDKPILFDSFRAPVDGRPWSPLFSSRPSRPIVFYPFSVRRSHFSYRPSILLVLGKESSDAAFFFVRAPMLIPIRRGLIRYRKPASTNGIPTFPRDVWLAFAGEQSRWPFGASLNESILFHSIMSSPTSFQEQKRTCPFVFLIYFYMGSNRDR